MNKTNQKRWEVAEKMSLQAEQELGEYGPVLRQLLYNRGITEEMQAYNFLKSEGSMFDPFLMTGMRIAVERLLQAMDQGEQVVVYGDYDVDGVTATTLLVQVLRKMGANVRGYIPNRFEEGYGLNNEALAQLAEQGSKVVVTVDCGIRSPGEAEFARQCGIDLIISDHHEPKQDLPQALAVICPKQEGDAYPEKNLAGVGLAFKIAEALLNRRPVAGVNAPDWLDLVAVGTVADMVPLKGENRALVRAGLKRTNQGQRQGLRSLVGAAGMDSSHRLTARDIGYMIGPRLNAAGRLESALAAFELLMTEDIHEAGSLAQKLNNQNRQRQELTATMQQEAEEWMQTGEVGNLIFSVRPDFNKGVVGLVAARLVESFYRPAVVGEMDSEFTRASCRSIPEFHITSALDECAHLLERHGGHAMAAGFTVRNENLPALEMMLKAIAARELAERDLRPTLRADIELALKDLKPEILRDLEVLEPTGLGNREALFVSRHLRVTRARKIGSEQQHLRLTVTDGRVSFDAVAFRQGEWADAMPETVDLLYAYEVNNYQGRTTLQLNVRDIKPG
jgi:single-stranded-DNA-specific exonuclease